MTDDLLQKTLDELRGLRAQIDLIHDEIRAVGAIELDIPETSSELSHGYLKALKQLMSGRLSTIDKILMEVSARSYVISGRLTPS